jgi:ribosome-binding protein aMBF1 (putative translation factor)
MTIRHMTLDGKDFVVIPREEFEAMAGRRRAPLPELPKPDHNGNVPAMAYARASLARKIIAAREAAGLSQAGLARAARIAPAVLNRIERAKVVPTEATCVKIERAIARARRPSRAS